MPINLYKVGVTERVWDDPVRQRILVATIWYPTMLAEEAVCYFTSINSYAKRDAAIVQKKFPLVIVSHGSAGNRYNQYYLAEFLVRYGYIIAALQHPFDNSFDNTAAETIANLWHRPRDISYVLDQMLSDAIFAAYIDAKKIALLGHSFGGYAAIILAGAVPQAVCLQKRYSSKQEISHYNFKQQQDERIKCIFIMAPALAQVFTFTELKKVAVPVFIAFSGKDEILKGEERYYLTMLPSRDFCLEFSGAGHYVYLMEATARIKAQWPQPWIDIGTPRQLVHPILQQKCLEFLEQHLKNNNE